MIQQNELKGSKESPFPVSVRPYQDADYPTIEKILRSYKMFYPIWEDRDNLAGMVKKDPESILVATLNNNVIGNVMLMSYGPKTAYLFRLAVTQEHRNKGVGSQLLDAAKEVLRKKGVEELAIYVDAAEQELQEFYLQKGFQTVRRPYISMWLNLSK